MFRFYFPLFVFVFFIVENNIWSQKLVLEQPSNAYSFECGESIVHKLLFDLDPASKTRHDKMEQTVLERRRQHKEAKSGVIYTLPVVVHIIHNGGAENISDARVEAGIQHLNEGFAHQGYFAQAGLGTDTKIQFCLAQRTPDGYATNGITRNQSPLTNMEMETQDLNVKNINRWDPTQYVNIWVVNEITSQTSGSGVAGYAYFASSHGSTVDGLMCEARFFGASPSQDAVVIHEIGHYLNLYHTFQGGCPNANCLTDGDRVCDTPPDQSTFTACPFNSCNTDVNAPAPNPFTTDVNDMTENFMDYSPFSCFYRFTDGQAARMQDAVLNIRSSLLESEGCKPPCPTPIVADFLPNANTVLAGNTLGFTNQTTGATQYTWKVDGVTLSNQTDFSHLFNSLGIHEITLIAENDLQFCLDSIVKTIEVICPIMADFSFSPLPAFAGNALNMNDLSINAQTYQWWTDGDLIANTANPSHVFNFVGPHMVMLVVSTANFGGCTDTMTAVVQVNCPVTANITASAQEILVGESIDFNSTTQNATTLTWFINGAEVGNGNSSFTQQFAIPGTYTIVLKAENAVCSATKSIFVKVNTPCGLSGDEKIKYTTDERILWHDVDVLGSGETFLAGEKGVRPLLAKLDGGGNMLWAKRADWSAAATWLEVHPTPDGGLLHLLTEQARIFLLKTDVDGNQIWAKQMDYPGFNGASEGKNYLAVQSDGTFLLEAESSSGGIMHRFGADGNLIWCKQALSISRGIAPANDATNGYYLSFFGTNASNTPSMIVWKIAPAGNIIYRKSYPMPSSWVNSTFGNLQGTADGGFAFMVAGSNTNNGIYQKGLVRCRPDGSVNWSKFYSTDGLGISVSADKYAAGEGWLMKDWTYEPVSGQSGLVIRLVGEDGLTRWTQKVTQPIAGQNDGGRAMGFFSGGSVAVPYTENGANNFSWLKTHTQGDAGACFTTSKNTEVTDWPLQAVNTNQGIWIDYPPNFIDFEMSFSDVVFQRSLICNINPLCVENCDNNLDDDDDGYVDCFDADCKCSDGDQCTAPPFPNNFSAALAWQSTVNTVSVLSTPIIANLDPQRDSMPEIVVATCKASSSVFGNKLLIFKGDGSNNAAPVQLDIPFEYDNYPIAHPMIADVNKDGIPELLLVTADNYIRVYRDYNPTASPAMKMWIKSDQETDNEGNRPYLADFNGDGIPEVYAGNTIFQFDFTNPTAPALRLVLDGSGTSGSIFYFSSTQPGANPTAMDMLSREDCNGDPDCDGLELVAGPMIYSIDIDPFDGDGMQIKVKRDLNALTPGKQWDDGYTTVADVNLDGIPDVIVASKEKSANKNGLYIWDKNGLIRFFPYPGNYFYASGGVPTVANVFDDRTKGFAKDFPEILVVNSYFLNCFNLNAASLVPSAPWWWSLATTDYSGFTGSTVFDFNGDGLQEIVYRDEDDLRILYGGAAPFPAGVDNERNWFKFPVGSITADEYATVADLDNDGQAEIAVCGYTFSGYNSPASDYRGRLRVFESASKPWLPCRNLWNTFNYFGLNIKDDLTVPAAQQKHWLEFPGPGGGKYPYNNYLAQLPLFDSAYSPLFPVPDALASVDSISCADGNLLLRVRICNEGSAPLPEGTPVRFYKGNPTQSGANLLNTAQFLTTSVPVDSCRVFDFTIPMPSTGQIFGIVNDDGSVLSPFDLALDFPSTDQPECNYLNNIFSFNVDFQLPVLALGPDVQMCNSSVTNLSATGGFVKYRWQDGSPESIYTAFLPGKYWVDAWDICGVKQTDTVHITINPLNQIDLGMDRGICTGDSLLLTAQGFPNATWHVQGTIICNECETILVKPSQATVYHATAQNGNCITSDSVMVKLFPMMQLDLVGSNPLCPDGFCSITSNVSGSPAPYQYIWSNNAIAASVDSLNTGTYAITVVDGNGCKSSDSIFVTRPEPVVVTSAIAAIDCFGGQDGALNLSLAAGNPPFSFIWSDGFLTQNRQNLAAGNYAVTVFDVNHCPQMFSYSLQNPPEISLASNVLMPKCFGNADGIISMKDSKGGTPPLHFNWSSSILDTTLIAGLSAGNYMVTVSDSKGCTKMQSFTLQQPEALAVTAALTPPLCATSADGNIALLQTNGGTAPYIYFWDGLNSNNANVTNLTGGMYHLSVTDGNGCSKTEQFILQSPVLLTFNENQHLPSCFGKSDGYLEIQNLIGGTPPLMVSWGNGLGTAAKIENIGAGDYPVTITDAHGCTSSKNITLTEPAAIVVNGLTSDPKCFGGTDGSIVLNNPMGGTPPFTFSWQNSQDTAVLHQNLSAGNYAATITDAHGCTQIQAFSLTEPPLLIVISNVSAPKCFDSNDGSIALTALGGVSPYIVAWGNSTHQGSNFNQLSSGTYAATLTDSHGCNKLMEWVLTAPPIIEMIAQKNEPKCFAGNDGAVAVENIQGGIAPYAYKWQNGITTASLNGLEAGNYTVTVTDAHGCTQTESIDLQQPASIVIDGLVALPTCFGSADGQINMSSTGGGTPPLNYYWANGLGNGSMATDLLAGNYTLTVSDAHGCNAVKQFLLSQPEAIVSNAQYAHPLCYGSADGLVELTLSGGTVPLSVHWSNNDNTAILGQLMAGTYAATITDANGCSKSEVVQLIDPPAMLIADTAVTPVSCIGTVDGSINITMEGGTVGNGYQYNWSNAQTTATLLNVAAGSYALTVTDMHQCSLVAEFLVAQPPTLFAGIDVQHDTCGNNIGVLDLEVLGGTPPYQYQWSNGSTLQDLDGKGAGNYIVTVIDAHGCNLDLSKEIRKIGETPLFEVFEDTITCKQKLVNVGVLSGMDSLIYYWKMPNGTQFIGENQLVNLSGNYLITAKDFYGCTSQKSIFVVSDTVPPIAAIEATELVVPCDVGAVTLEGMGTPINNNIVAFWYSEMQGPSVTIENGLNVAVGQPGKYFFEVKNLQNGCMAKDSIRIDWAPPITLSTLVVDSISCFRANDGLVSIQQVFGGTPPYHYSFNGSAFGAQNTFNHLLPDKYGIVIQDSFHCQWETMVTLLQPDSFALRLLASDTLIHNGENVMLEAFLIPSYSNLNGIQWKPATFFGDQQSLNQIVAPKETTLFEVYAVNEDGCPAHDRVKVRVIYDGIYVPNVFYPGTSDNPVFTLFGGKDAKQVNLLRIYDRWGDLVFENKDFNLNDLSEGWDGSFLGKPMNPGVFGFYGEIELWNGKIQFLKGDVTLVR